LGTKNLVQVPNHKKSRMEEVQEKIGKPFESHIKATQKSLSKSASNIVKKKTFRVPCDGTSAGGFTGEEKGKGHASQTATVERKGNADVNRKKKRVGKKKSG